MPYRDHGSYQFHDLQDQKLLTACRHLFSELGKEHVAFSFGYKGGQYLIYECLHPIPTQITQDARTNIVDTPLTLIFSMGQGEYFSFCQL